MKASAQWKTFIVGLVGALTLIVAFGAEHAWAENSSTIDATNLQGRTAGGFSTTKPDSD